MSNRPVKCLLAMLAVLLLALAPTALRLSDSHPHWVSVRLGTRPAQDDPDHQLMRTARQQLGLQGERLDPTVLLFGVFIGLLGLLAAGLPLNLTSIRAVRCAALPPESGLLRGSWSSRAPPLA